MTLIIGILTTILFISFFTYNTAAENKKDETINKAKKEYGIELSNQPFLGNKDAKVSIVEFGDYKCPYCKLFNGTYDKQIIENYVKTGVAKLYYLNFAFLDDDSVRAAEYSEAVFNVLGNDAFWEFHDSVFMNSPENKAKDVLTEDVLNRILKEIATENEVTQVLEAVKNGIGSKGLDVDHKLREELGVQGTPTILINGEIFTGQSFEELQDMIERSIK